MTPTSFVALFAALGVGTVLGAFIASRASARKDMWENLRWADDKLDSDDDDTARGAFNHLSDWLDEGGLNRMQRSFAATSTRNYLRRTT